MGNNKAPTEEEVDEFMEIYADVGTKKGVADRVDWSRPTVSKWIDRRLEEREQEEQEDEQQVQAEPMSAAPGDTAPAEPEGDYTDSTRTEGYNSNPVDVEEPPSPNEVLLSVVDRDPKLGEDEAEYLQQFFPDYGQLSPSDVATILNDLNFNNKRKTIDRVISRYRDICNRKLREDPDLQYDKRWAVLLTKETGDQRYIQQAQEYQPRGGGIGGINAPPTGMGGTQQMTGGGAGITAPASGPTGANQQANMQNPPSPQQNGQAQQFAPQPQQQDNGINEFQQRILDMLEEQLDDDDPNPQPIEQSDPGSQIEQLVELQGQLQKLKEMGNDGDDKAAKQIESVADQFEKRMARLEQQVTEAATQQQTQPVQPTETGEASLLTEIATLAETGVSQDLLEMFMEMQMDPEVMEARAKTKEVKSDSEWKKAIAENLSPAAAEKAIDAFSTAASSLSRGAQAAQRQPAYQPPAPQQPQQPQPQQRPQAAPPRREASGVEVVEEQEQPTQDVAEEPRTAETESDGEASPLRKEGEKLAADNEESEMDAEPEEESTETEEEQ